MNSGISVTVVHRLKERENFSNARHYSFGVTTMNEIRFLTARTKHAVKRGLKRTARTIGYDIVKYHSEPVSPRAFPQDFTPHHISILTKVGPYTLTSPERIYSLIEAVTYVVRAKIPGSIVECGVWRGGSMMAAALTLRSMKCDDRDLYLFDTFEGMPKPLALDVHASGHAAMTEFVQEQSGPTPRPYAMRL